MKPLMTAKEMFSSNSSLSTMRVLVFLVVIVILSNWTYINIITGQLQSLDFGTVSALIGALSAKAYQKKVEGPIINKNQNEDGDHNESSQSHS